MPSANEPSELSESGMADQPTLYLKVVVKDTGRGIESHDLETLFQRFQQGSPRTHVKYGGSGLGLFICKELAGLQGGQVGVASVSGEGATFAFYVAATPCPSPKVEKLHAEVNGGDKRKINTSEGEDETGSKMVKAAKNLQVRPAHILLVEDNLGKYRDLMVAIRSFTS